MSPIESTGAAAVARGSPHMSHSAHAARSGADKAQALQNAATAPAAAPVETVRAIAQSQASARSRMKTEPPAGNQAVRKSAQQTLSQKAAPPGAKKPNLSLTKPMTAVLLHELRLQRELADVQEEVKQKRA